MSTLLVSKFWKWFRKPVFPRRLRLYFCRSTAVNSSSSVFVTTLPCLLISLMNSSTSVFPVFYIAACVVEKRDILLFAMRPSSLCFRAWMIFFRVGNWTLDGRRALSMSCKWETCADHYEAFRDISPRVLTACYGNTIRLTLVLHKTEKLIVH